MSDLSIVIPVYQTKIDLFERCLSSASQTNAEIIVVDDGSFLEQSNRYQVLCQSYHAIYVYQTNQGISAARNTGMNLANRKMIYFLDSDDCLTKQGIEALSQIEYEPESIQWFGYVMNGKTYIPSQSDARIDDLIRCMFKWDNRLKNMHPVVVWNKVFDRLWLQRNGIQFLNQLRLGEDTLFLYELYQLKPHIHVHQVPLIEYFIYKNSLSHQSKESIHIELLEWIKALYQVYQRDHQYIDEISFWVQESLRDHWLANFQQKPRNKQEFCQLMEAKETRFFLAHAKSFRSLVFSIPSYTLWHAYAQLRMILRKH